MPTDTSAPLPDLQVQSLSTYTVTLDDPAAVITQLVVHGDQQSGENIEDLTLSQIYLTPRNPADFGGPGG